MGKSGARGEVENNIKICAEVLSKREFTVTISKGLLLLNFPRVRSLHG